MTLTPALIDAGLGTKLLDVVAVTLLLFVGLMATLNLGNKAIVNLKAQDEHLVMAVGGGMMFAGVWFPTYWWLTVLGTLLALYGAIARFTGYADISEVI